MENRSRKKKEASKKKEISENRSPLQDLNGHVLIHRKNYGKNCTNSSSVSVEATKERSLHPSCSSSSTPCSSSTKTLTKKPKPQSKLTNCTTQKSAAAAGGGGSLVLRSEENDIRKKSISQKLRKNNPHFLYQRKINKKSTLSSGPRNPVNTSKKGLEEFGEKINNLQESGPGESTIEQFGISNSSNCLNSVENCTPAGKLACGSGLEFLNLYGNKNKREDSTSRTIASNCSTATKTPPVEASVSPEIQCGSHSKVLVSTAFMTPICYGAGHLISGVTDKRMCRSRGILTVGRENSNLFEYKSNERKVTKESRASLIPIPAEAWLHWMSSPCDEEPEGNDRNLKTRLERCRMISGNDYMLLDLGSSPSTLSGNVSDFVCNSDSYSVYSNVGDTASTGKTRNVLLSPRRTPELHGFSGPSSRKIDEFFIVDTPHCTPTGKAINSQEDKGYSYNQIGDSAAGSVGSLSSGNVIQTPDSNSSSERHIDNYEHQGHHFESEFESVTEILQGVSLSPRSKMLMCDTPGLDMHCDLSSNSHSIDLNQLPKKNLDKTSSVFESMSENLSLSQMRISWRDGLVSQTYEMDEFDCCRCLSDEEVDAEGCASKHLMAFQGTESSANKEFDVLRNSRLKSPVLECESNISEKRRAILSPHRRNSCAESICTNGGGLVASGDSDWTICYENHFI
ncbi:Hypothetical predicted protein [Olea europaea subsp. europaea]|uniref:Uncharacterized protein n=1 Tax=Olea europaea subsp. europaea TaxID=158383 RepID=A0A8S0U3F6_OLEEU|nr:Hypothetical predicted protein [Olea europaea subsp. europaea]